MYNKIASLLALAAGSFLLFGCEEIPPTIESCNTDRVVLVEEFTGIDCVNCPVGSEKLEQLSALPQNAGKMVVVAIHAGFFAIDYQGFDLRCPDGEDLEANYLGPVAAYPSATINRNPFDGNELPIGVNEWAGRISSELCNRPDATLAITPTFDENTREVTVTVDVTPSPWINDVVEEDLAVTVMITESGMEGYQKTPNGSDYNYTHKHVLRDVLSDTYTGDIIIGKGKAWEAKQKVIGNYTLSNDWNADKCHVVAFIHYKGGDNRRVLQAGEVDLK